MASPPNECIHLPGIVAFHILSQIEIGGKIKRLFRMMSMKSWLAGLLIVVLATIALLPFSPIYRPAPADDASIYLYIADRILEGGVPYLDGWDQKPPLIYFIFALARAATPQSIWGLWWLQWLGWLIFGFSAYYVLAKVVNPGVAFLSVAVSFLILVEFFWGGSIEDTSLMFQMLSVACFAHILSTEQVAFRPWSSLAAGLLAGILFFMKQTLIAVSIAIGVYLLLRAITQANRRSWYVLAWMAAGASMVALLVFLYFWLKGGLEEYWRQAFVFNWMYSNLGLLERVNSLVDGLEFLSGYPGMFMALSAWLAGAFLGLRQFASLLISMVRLPASGILFAAAGFAAVVLAGLGEIIGSTPGIGLGQAGLLAVGLLLIAAGVYLLSARRQQQMLYSLQSLAPLHNLWKTSPSSPKIAFLNLAVMFFLFTLLLISTSGRNYVYYFIPLVPPAVLLFGLLIDLFFAQLTQQVRSLAIILLTALLLVFLIRPALFIASAYRAPRFPPPSALETYITSTTRRDDPVLVWGRYTTYLYITTQRKSPTRFYNQAAFHLPAYVERYRIYDILLSELRANPPVLIITDPQVVTAEQMQLPVCKNRELGDQGSFLYFICQNYRLEKTFGDQKVFRYTR